MFAVAVAIQRLALSSLDVLVWRSDFASADAEADTIVALIVSSGTETSAFYGLECLTYGKLT